MNRALPWIFAIFAMASFRPAAAQTYFHVNAISVTPGSPTDLNEVALNFHGELSNTASHVTTKQVSVIGQVITVKLRATQSGIGLDVLVDHVQEAEVGQLAAGTYTIVLQGQGVYDAAPPEEHQFTVQGAGPSAFYVEGIAVIPGTPTTQDEVSIELQGNLASSNSVITSTSASVSGSVVTLTVNTHSFGIGMPVLAPHDETVEVGPLAAGAYTIVLQGVGMQDGVPADEHTFTVVPGNGTVCDHAGLGGVMWSPFDADLITVRLNHPSVDAFPAHHITFGGASASGSFSAVEAGDVDQRTLRVQRELAFGADAITPDAYPNKRSWHFLQLQPGSNVPVDPYQASLDLYLDSLQAGPCSWNLYGNLCPPEPCSELMVLAKTPPMWGGLPPIAAPVNYDIAQNGISVASGVLAADGGVAADMDKVCLPPGQYELTITTNDAGTTGLDLFLTIPQWAASKFLHVTSGTTTMPFSYYPNCTGTGPLLALAPPADLLQVRSLGDQLNVQRANGDVLGQVRLMDAQGHLLFTAVNVGLQQAFNMAAFPAGLYFVQALDAQGALSTVRWMKP
jgi:hypothetical protein